MKLQYKLGLIALGLIAFSSCEKNDPIADMAQIGQRVPTCFWEVGSTTGKAGEYVSFKGKYYTEDGHTPSHSEVWYNVSREDFIEATSQLGGLKYSKAISLKEEMRTNQCIAQYSHSKAIWTVSDSIVDTTATGEYGYQWMIIDSVKISETLIPDTWKNPTEWGTKEEEQMAKYIPEGFVKEFEEYMDSALMLDGAYENLRKVYTDYAFTNEQIQAVNNAHNVNLPLMDETKYDPSDSESLKKYKSKLWYDYNNFTKIVIKTEGRKEIEEEVAANTDIIGYYYELEGEPVMADSIIKTETGEYLPDSITPVYPVYDSAPWVFSRLNPNSGSVVSTVRPEYINAFKQLVEYVTFPEWIYSSSDGYVISFNRGYLLDATFKVIDESGNVGVAFNKYTITVN